MKLTLLGTGCPAVSAERHGPAALLRHGDQAVLIDCGSGVTQRLLEAGCPGRDLDAVLLTHLHSDHIVDLFQLVISSWHQGRDRPQRVFGPKGTKAYVAGLMALWRPELEQRIAHERRPSTLALELEVVEFEAGPLDLSGPMRIDAIEVDHKPVERAFGFHFEAGGRRLVVSGDTRRCPALIAAARDADLLLHEVFVHRDMPLVEGVRTAETIANVAGYHTLSGEVGKIAAEADVAALMLTHFVPPEADRAALLAEVAADFSGPVILGEDLMTYDLAAARLTHGRAHIGLPRRPGSVEDRGVSEASNQSQSSDASEAGEGSAEGPPMNTVAAAVEKLAVRARERGYVTYEDLHAVLPPGQTSSRQIEDVMASLSDKGITVIEGEEPG